MSPSCLRHACLNCKGSLRALITHIRTYHQYWGVLRLAPFQGGVQSPFLFILRHCFADMPKMCSTDQDPHGSDRYYLLDNYVSIEGRHVEYNVTWQLPYGVTTEHGIMSCEFITAHKCAPARGCDPAICGMYSIGEDTWGWPDDPLKAEEPCEDPLNAVPTQGPQVTASITMVFLFCLS